MNLKDVRLFSFFSGAGFLDLGFEKSGYEVVFANECFKPFLDAYCYAREGMGISKPYYRYFNDDIAKLLETNREELENMVREQRTQSKIIGFIGGPPCPDFSVGGKNRGRHGDNGKLSAIYANLICLMKPDFFLFENVKGLWRTKAHRAFFEELKQQFHLNGYVTTEKLINAIEYGAPQDRERIILLGFRRNFLDLIGHTVGENQIELDYFPWDTGIKYKKDELWSMHWPDKEQFSEGRSSSCPSEIPEELTVEHWFRQNDVDNHPNARDFFQPREGLKKMLVIEEGDDSKKSYKRLHRWRYSPTAAYGNNEVHLHPYKARRISVAEALAIQSLPKEFCLPKDMTLTDKFKTVGNGVPYLASKGLAEAISKFLEG